MRVFHLRMLVHLGSTAMVFPELILCSSRLSTIHCLSIPSQTILVITLQAVMHSAITDLARLCSARTHGKVITYEIVPLTQKMLLAYRNVPSPTIQ